MHPDIRTALNLKLTTGEISRVKHASLTAAIQAAHDLCSDATAMKALDQRLVDGEITLDEYQDLVSAISEDELPAMEIPVEGRSSGSKHESPPKAGKQRIIVVAALIAVGLLAFVVWSISGINDIEVRTDERVDRLSTHMSFSYFLINLDKYHGAAGSVKNVKVIESNMKGGILSPYVDVGMSEDTWSDEPQDNKQNTLTYTATENYVGEETFRYSYQDRNDETKTAIFVIELLPNDFTYSETVELSPLQRTWEYKIEPSEYEWPFVISWEVDHLSGGKFWFGMVSGERYRAFKEGQPFIAFIGGGWRRLDLATGNFLDYLYKQDRRKEEWKAGNTNNSVWLVGQLASDSRNASLRLKVEGFRPLER